VVFSECGHRKALRSEKGLRSQGKKDHAKREKAALPSYKKVVERGNAPFIRLFGIFKKPGAVRRGRRKKNKVAGFEGEKARKGLIVHPHLAKRPPDGGPFV